MQAWAQFYAVVGSAAAALLGLLFVAVSLNPAATLGEDRSISKRLAEQAFQNYVAVLLVSLLALFPDLRMSSFGYSTLGVTAVSGGWSVVRLFQTLLHPAGQDSRLRALRRHATALAGFGMLTYSAWTLAHHIGDDRDWLAASMMVLLLSSTTVSWELLGRLARARAAAPAAPAP